MFLQILPADKVTLVDIILENQLFFVILGLAIGAFVIIRIAKLLSKIKIKNLSKSPSKRPSYTIQ